jgi:hypothetical protein
MKDKQHALYTLLCASPWISSLHCFLATPVSLASERRRTLFVLVEEGWKKMSEFTGDPSELLYSSWRSIYTRHDQEKDAKGNVCT